MSEIKELFIKEDRRRERWSLTPVGWLTAILLTALLLLAGFLGYQTWESWRTGGVVPLRAQSAQTTLTPTYLLLPPKAREEIRQAYIEGRDWFWDGRREDPVEAEKLFINIPPEVIEERPGMKIISAPDLLTAIIEGRRERREKGIYWQSSSLGKDSVEIVAFYKDENKAVIANHFPLGWMARCYSRETGELIQERRHPPGWMEASLYYVEDEDRWKIGYLFYHEIPRREK